MIAYLPLASLSIFAALPPLPNAVEVANHLDRLYRADSSHGRMTMRIVTKDYRRQVTMETWSDGTERSLVLIRDPAKERGTATLANQDGVWNYAPRSDRLIRMPSSLLADSWMGSHFTNDDLVKRTSLTEDHDIKLRWVKLGGKACLELTMTPHENTPVAYTKIIEVVTSPGWTPIRADYYDGKKAVRRLQFGVPKKFGKTTLPSVIELVPADKPGESTKLIYEELVLGAKVDASIFTAGGLRRIAHK